jgi:hypothetical protein
VAQIKTTARGPVNITPNLIEASEITPNLIEASENKSDGPRFFSRSGDCSSICIETIIIPVGWALPTIIFSPSFGGRSPPYTFCGK